MKNTLISVAELAALPPAEVLIVDCRFDLADPDKSHRDFQDGHIPGAVYASLDGDLSDLSRVGQGLGRHPLPSAASFAQWLRSAGWQPGLQVVGYDAAYGALAAARLWWLLRLANIQPVAVLDGGIQAWNAAGLPLQAASSVRASSQVDVHFDTRQVIVDHTALGAMADALLIDARAAPRYRGEVEPIDRVGGHVPGAVNHPFAENLGADGRFKPASELRQSFVRLLGGHVARDVVHMCGSGVTACHNLLAMEHAGLSGSRLYAPSWSGWVSDPTRPVATGD